MMPRRPEEGFTLVELLIAVAIMGILFVAVFAGMATFIKSTVVHRSTADIDGVVRAYSERVTSIAYVPCATSATYFGGGALISLPAGYTYTAPPTVKYWNANNPPTFSAPGSCPGTDNGLQQVSVTIQQTSSLRTQTLTLVKRAT